MSYYHVIRFMKCFDTWNVFYTENLNQTDSIPTYIHYKKNALNKQVSK